MGTNLFSVWYEIWYQTENKQTQREKSGIETQHLTDRVLPDWTSLQQKGWGPCGWFCSW